MDNPRTQISELHVDKFRDTADSQCSKVNFKTEVCSNSGCPTIAKLWIKEVEIAESVDDHVTSQSIEGRDFLVFEMLDAKITSAMRRGSSPISISEEGSVSMSRPLKKYNRFPRERQIAYMICHHFRATDAHDAALDLSDLFQRSLTRG